MDLFLVFLVFTTVTESVNGGGKKEFLAKLLRGKGKEKDGDCSQHREEDTVDNPEADHEELEHALMKWETEEQRLRHFTQMAYTGDWKWRCGKDQGTHQVPWLFDIGKNVEESFIRYCSASMIDLEHRPGDYILITSATCAHLLEEEKRFVSGLQRVAATRELTVHERVEYVKYHHEYIQDTDPNIAILRTSGDVRLSRSTRSRLYLPFSTADTAVQSGLVVWRSFHYVRNHLSTPGETYTKKASIHECDGEKQAMVFCVVLAQKDTHPSTHQPINPTTDLGGSPFYIKDRDGRPVLRGIRTGLQGDQFTDIDPFVDWIREQAKDQSGWKPVP